MSIKALDLGKRPCNPSPELKVLLLKHNSILWDKIEVYEKYAEQERALRIQAVSAFRKHEGRMFGKVQEIKTEVQKELKDDRSSGSDEPTQKRTRVNTMRAGGAPPR